MNIYDIEDIPEHLKGYFEDAPQIGLEETPEQYVQKLVEIFREVKRVLRSDGTFWLNIGDSYAGSGRGPTGHNGIGNQTERQGFDKQDTNRGSLKYNPLGGVVPPSCKPKDLIGIPWMLAFALRADGAASPETMFAVERIRNSLLEDFDSWAEVPKCTKRAIEELDIEWAKAAKGGWYLRSDIPWIKRNSMPSSVRDRPASSIEHIFLFSKSKTYYYDYVATMQPSSESYNKDKRPRGQLTQRVGKNRKDYGNHDQFRKQDNVGNNTYTGFNARYEDPGTGLRFMRDSDFFFRTWQGLLHNENGEPIAMVVNPRGYKGAHFACFPVQLVEPMILAGTSERGVCPVCGAPWVRVTEKKSSSDHTGQTDCAFEKGSNANRMSMLRQQARENGGEYSTVIETTGWKPSCSCGIAPISSVMCGVPATVLDTFSGSGATGVACQWHNRDYVGIELNSDYCNLQQHRLKENK